MVKTTTKKDKPAIRNVCVSVDWGYLDYECPMSLQTWKSVVRGNEVNRSVPYWYENSRFSSSWEFNSRGQGSLVVHSEGVFTGDMTQARIYIDDERVSWTTALFHYGTKKQRKKVAPDRLKELSATQDYDYWLIAGERVTEPSIDGKPLPELKVGDLTAKRVLHISQEDLALLLEAHRASIIGLDKMTIKQTKTASKNFKRGSEEYMDWLETQASKLLEELNASVPSGKAKKKEPAVDENLQDEYVVTFVPQRK